MQNPMSPLATEYKVRPVVRYLITRYEPYWSPDPRSGGCNSSKKFCEFESEEAAEEFAGLLNDGEAERLHRLKSSAHMVAAEAELTSGKQGASNV